MNPARKTYTGNDMVKANVTLRRISNAIVATFMNYQTGYLVLEKRRSSTVSYPCLDEVQRVRHSSRRTVFDAHIFNCVSLNHMTEIEKMLEIASYII